jgi:hypothetical protein
MSTTSYRQWRVRTSLRQDTIVGHPTINNYYSVPMKYKACVYIWGCLAAPLVALLLQLITVAWELRVVLRSISSSCFSSMLFHHLKIRSDILLVGFIWFFNYLNFDQNWCKNMYVQLIYATTPLFIIIFWTSAQVQAVVSKLTDWLTHHHHTQASTQARPTPCARVAERYSKSSRFRTWRARYPDHCGVSTCEATEYYPRARQLKLFRKLLFSWVW